MNILQDLLQNENCSTTEFFESLHSVLSSKQIKNIDINKLELIDQDLIDEIRNLSLDLTICFGKSIRDLKVSVVDPENLRTHDILIKYKGLKKITVSSVELPYSQLQDREYSSIEDVVATFMQYIKNLSAYLNVLESIDRHFTVVEPVKPTFKEDYRKIVLDDRVWLHLEITINGSAANVHLVGQSEEWHDKLQEKLLLWDHDKQILENIFEIFEAINILKLDKHKAMNVDTPENKKTETISCGICYCVELPDVPGVPQPLCPNKKCDVMFHKSCLFQWLVASEGGRVPAFGVANGSCPTCLHPISCSEKDD